MSAAFVRTVLGDVDATTLHACDAHEHVWIGPSRATADHPDFLLTDTTRIVAEMRTLKAAGVDWLIDCMPQNAGGDAEALAALSRRSGMHIVAATGVHLEQYYTPGAAEEWLDKPNDLAEQLHCDIEPRADGRAKCGVIKVAGSLDQLTAAERVMFEQAALASVATGCPIITHTEAGTAATEQIDLILGNGCESAKVTLSHVDRIADADIHRALLRRGVNLEYDGHFRYASKNGPLGANPTIDLIAGLLPEFPDQIVVGMDAARSSYWHSYGGRPGLSWLVAGLRPMLKARGLSDALLERLYVLNPRRAFSFSAVRKPSKSLSESTRGAL